MRPKPNWRTLREYAWIFGVYFAALAALVLWETIL